MNFVRQYHLEPRTEKEREALYGRIRKIAYWLDSFAVVGGFPLGVEAIIGFIPVVGDFLGLVASLYQVYLCFLFGLPIQLMLRMLLNVIIDFVVGLIPWVGDILDVFYKSNQYNLSILANWLQDNRLVDVQRYNREHPLANGTEPRGRTNMRSRAAGVGNGYGFSR